MLQSIQNYQVTQSKVNFIGKKRHTSDIQKDENPVYKTHAGLKTGIGYGIVQAGYAGLLATGASFMQDIMRSQGRNFIPDPNTAGKISKIWFLYIPAAILTSIGCGALVDSAINKKHAEFAKKTENKDKKEILRKDEQAELSRTGEVYYHTSIGKKIGPVFGLVLTPLLGLGQHKIAGRQYTVGKLVINAVVGAVGGLLLGAITDRVANKGAAKFADKQAMAAEED